MHSHSHKYRLANTYTHTHIQRDSHLVAGNCICLCFFFYLFSCCILLVLLFVFCFRQVASFVTQWDIRAHTHRCGLYIYKIQHVYMQIYNALVQFTFCLTFTLTYNTQLINLFNFCARPPRVGRGTQNTMRLHISRKHNKAINTKYYMYTYIPTHIYIYVYRWRYTPIYIYICIDMLTRIYKKINIPYLTNYFCFFFLSCIYQILYTHMQIHTYTYK